MSATLTAQPFALRGSFLTAVVGVHAAALLALMATHSQPAREIIAPPMVVDLLTPAPVELPKPAVAKAQPASKPTTRPETRPTPRLTPQATLEATRSELPAAQAPAAAVPEARPAPAARQEQAPPAAPVTQARFDASYLRNPAPPYPPLSRRMGESGQVVLRVQVAADGTAAQLEIKTSSGSPRLDQSALTTVRSWKFVPAKRGEEAISSWVLVPIVFKLEQ